MIISSSGNSKTCDLTCSQRARDSTHKDGLARIEGLRTVHHEITVTQVPWSYLHLRGGITFNYHSGDDSRSQLLLLSLNSRVCLWWWGWTHTGRASRPPPCRPQSEPGQSSPPGTAGTRILQQTHPTFSVCTKKCLHSNKSIMPSKGLFYNQRLNK